jgi:phosphoribosylformylglycinamidine synthase
VEQTKTHFTNACRAGQVLEIPIAHMEGNYFADAATLDALEATGQIVLRYCAPDGEINDAGNPNGSQRNIAGIVNRQGNVLGMMPHPERACDPLLGSVDGRFIFQSVVNALLDGVASSAAKFAGSVHS